MICMEKKALQDLQSVLEAQQALDNVAVVPKIRRATIAEAQGLRLAEEIVADRDSPPFDKALMDGFAVHLEDLQSTQILQVAGEIAAGQSGSAELLPGQAMSIMTGAPLPRGADSIVPVEQTQLIDGGRRVNVTPGAASDRYISRRGSDCRAGQVVLPAGTRLEAPQLAVAASVGAHQLDVFSPPRAAILCTGDELVSVDQTPGDWQIRNSNEVMLAALLRRLGCTVRTLGCARDDVADIRAKILDGLNDDVLFVAGGMSMGKYDHVPAILRELGVEILISKLRIKPGKPFVFGTVQSLGDAMRYVFGLPGNPVSAFVCTLRLAARLLRRLSGGSAEQEWAAATLDAPLKANGPREFYQPAILRGSSVAPLNWKGSADIFTLARANALLVRPENDPPRAAGDNVRLMMIPSAERGPCGHYPSPSP